MDKHVPVRDLARKLSCSPETLKRQLRDGTIPGTKVGRDWRVDPEAVKIALDNKRKR
jgi:excisionase family DNA binding protein